MKKSSLFTAILLVFGIVLTAALVTSTPLIADNNGKKHGKKHCKKPLRSITDYSLVAQYGVLDDEGRLLVWKATLTGDIDGIELWWFNQPSPPGGVYEDYELGFYTGRWEIYDEDPLPFDGTGLGTNPDAELLLAGISAGETLIPLDPDGQDGIWDGRGKVTEANAKFKKFIGRHMYEGGPVKWDLFPFYGVGKIRIYCKHNSYGFSYDGKNEDDELDKVSAEAVDEIGLLEEFELMQNYPNPFNPKTIIRFQLAEGSHVQMRLFNSLGQEVRTLVDKQYEAGLHSVDWNGEDKNGNLVSSGVYFYVLETAEFVARKKMILVR